MYGKGICRSNQESTNLRIAATWNDVTSAESFHTASFVQFPGKDLTAWREAVYNHTAAIDVVHQIEIDRRNPHRRTATQKKT